MVHIAPCICDDQALKRNYCAQRFLKISLSTEVFSEVALSIEVSSQLWEQYRDSGILLVYGAKIALSTKVFPSAWALRRQEAIACY